MESDRGGQQVDAPVLRFYPHQHPVVGFPVSFRQALVQDGHRQRRHGTDRVDGE